MRLVSLSVDNFKSFYGSHTIHFGPETTLIIGQNGSGKSSMAQAIAVAFDIGEKKKALSLINGQFALDNIDAREISCTIIVVVNHDDAEISVGKRIIHRRQNNQSTKYVSIIDGEIVEEDIFSRRLKGFLPEKHFCLIQQDFFYKLAQKTGSDILSMFERISGSAELAAKSAPLSRELNESREELKIVESKLDIIKQFREEDRNGETIESIQAAMTESETMITLAKLWKLDNEVVDLESQINKIAELDQPEPEQENGEVELEAKISRLRRAQKEDLLRSTRRRVTEILSDCARVESHIRTIDKTSVSTTALKSQELEEIKVLQFECEKLQTKLKSTGSLHQNFLESDFLRSLEDHVVQELYRAREAVVSRNREAFEYLRQLKLSVERKLAGLFKKITEEIDKRKSFIQQCELKLDHLTKSHVIEKEISQKMCEQLQSSESIQDSLQQRIERTEAAKISAEKQIFHLKVKRLKERNQRLNSLFKHFESMFDTGSLIGVLGSLIQPTSEVYRKAFNRVFNKNLNVFVFADKESGLRAATILKRTLQKNCKFIVLPEKAGAPDRNIPSSFASVAQPIEKICKVETGNLPEVFQKRLLDLVRRLSRNLVYCTDEDAALELSMRVPKETRFSVVLEDGSFLSHRGVLETASSKDQWITPRNITEEPSVATFSTSTEYDDIIEQLHAELTAEKDKLQEHRKHFDAQQAKLLSVEERVAETENACRSSQQTVKSLEEERQLLLNDSSLLELRQLVKTNTDGFPESLASLQISATDAERVTQVLFSEYYPTIDMLASVDDRVARTELNLKIEDLKKKIENKMLRVQENASTLEECARQKNELMIKHQQCKEDLDCTRETARQLEQKWRDTELQIAELRETWMDFQGAYAQTRRSSAQKRVEVASLRHKIKLLNDKRRTLIIDLNNASLFDLPMNVPPSGMPYEQLPETAKRSFVSMEEFISLELKHFTALQLKLRKQTFGKMKKKKPIGYLYDTAEEMGRELERLKTRIGNLSTKLKDIDAERCIVLRNFIKAVQETVPVNYRWISEDLIGDLELELSCEDPEKPFEGRLQLVLNQCGKPQATKFNNLSNGQKAFATLALVLSVHEKCLMPFLILDESDSCLQEVHAQRLARVCVEYSTVGRQLIYISHRDSAASELQNFIIGCAFSQIDGSPCHFYYLYGEGEEVEELGEDLPGNLLELLEGAEEISPYF